MTLIDIIYYPRSAKVSKKLQKMSKNPSFSGRIRGQKICPFESYRVCCDFDALRWPGGGGGCESRAAAAPIAISVYLKNCNEIKNEIKKKHTCGSRCVASQATAAAATPVLPF